MLDNQSLPLPAGESRSNSLVPGNLSVRKINAFCSIEPIGPGRH